jgi:medium-chain acyl-[acyl-carrier-protein] hydrolase
MDAFSLEELKARPLRSIQINFISQIPYQGKVKIVRFENTNHHALLFGVNSEDPSIVHFQARIGFGA